MIIALLLSAAMCGQVMPQKTTYSRNVEIMDTIGYSADAFLVRVSPPLIYTYNYFDSIAVTPICYIPKKMSVYQYPYIYSFQVDVFKKIDNIKNGTFKIKTAKCEEFQEEGIDSIYTAKLNMQNPPKYDSDYKATMMYFTMDDFYFNIASMCGSKEIEVVINGVPVVPMQNRETSDYLLKVNNLLYGLYKSF